MQLFETKVKVERMQPTGVNKKVTEVYIVDAMSVTEAEITTTNNLNGAGEYQIVSVKEVRYTDIFGADADKYYQAKVNYLALDEKTGAVKKTPSLMLVNAESFKEAYDTLVDGMKGTMTDWELAELKETVILDILHHNS